jgi:hypothetical protein
MSVASSNGVSAVSNRFSEDTVTLSAAAQKAGSAYAASAGAASAHHDPVPSKQLGVSEATPNYVQQTTLENGQDVLQLGDVDSSANYFHMQGKNDFDYKGTCGLVSVGDVATQFGEKVTENYVVHYAVDHDETVVNGDASALGGTTMKDQVALLNGLGIPAHQELGNSLDGLGKELEEGHGAILEVNAGKLWNEPEYDAGNGVNHAVTVTGVAVDQETGHAVGVWINDSGTGEYKEFVAASNPGIQSWLKNGSPEVVTNQEHA